MEAPLTKTRAFVTLNYGLTAFSRVFPKKMSFLPHKLLIPNKK